MTMKDKVGTQDKISFVLNGQPIETKSPPLPLTLADLIRQEQERDKLTNQGDQPQK